MFFGSLDARCIGLASPCTHCVYSAILESLGRQEDIRRLVDDIDSSRMAKYILKALWRASCRCGFERIFKG